MNSTETLKHLEQYGRLLVAAGFRVWITRTSFRDGGYLTYERGGYWGHLQHSDYEGWQHDMPLIPSREYGSSMFIGDAAEDVWTIEAAEQAARAANHNDIVGTRPNAGDRTWLSRDARPLR